MANNLFGGTSGGMESIGGVMIGISVDLQGLTQGFAQAQTTAQAAGQNVANAFNAGATHAVQGLGQQIQSLGGPFAAINTAVGQFANTLQQAGAQASAFSLSMVQIGSTLTNIGGSLLKVGGILDIAVTAPIVGVGLASVKTAGEFEQARIAFETLTKSVEIGDRLLRDLINFAIQTPFEIPGLLDSSKRLLAFGFEVKELIPMLTTLGDAAAGLGMKTEGLNRLTLAFGEMRTRGTIALKELNQLAIAGIPAVEILAEKLGKTTAEIFSMTRKKMIESAEGIPLLLEGINERFGGMMKAQAQTLLGMWSNIKDAITKTLLAIGDTLLPMAKDLEKAVFPILAAVQGLAEEFGKLPQPLQLTVLGFAAFAAALGPIVTNIGLFLFSAGQIAEVIGALGPYMVTFAGSAGLAAGALSTLAVAVGVLGSAFAVAELVSVTKDAKALFDALTSGVDVLKSIGTSFGDAGKAISDLVIKLQLPAVINEQWSTFKTVFRDALLNALGPVGELSSALGKLVFALQYVTGVYPEMAAAAKRGAQSLQDYNLNQMRLTAASEDAKRVQDQFKRAMAEAGDETEKTSSKVKRHASVATESAASTREWAAAQQGIADNLAAQAAALDDLSGYLENHIDYVIQEAKAAQDYAIAVQEFTLQVQANGLAFEAAAEAARYYDEQLGRIPSIAGDAGTALEAMNTAAINKDLEGAKVSLDGLNTGVEENTKRTTAMGTAHTRAGTEIKNLYRDLTRGITDAIFAGKGFADTFEKIFESFAKSITRLVIDKLLEASGAVALLSKGIDKLMDWLGLGSSAAASAGSAAGQTAGAAGGAAGSAGGAISGALGSIGSMVNMISSAVTAITGVLSYLQGRRMEQDIGRIEVTTRGMLNVLALDGDNSVLGATRGTWFAVNSLIDRFSEFRAAGIGVYNQEGDQGLRVIGIGGEGSSDKENGEDTDPETGESAAAKDLEVSLDAAADAAQEYGEESKSASRSASSLADAASGAGASLDVLKLDTEQVAAAMRYASSSIKDAAIVDTGKAVNGSGVYSIDGMEFQFKKAGEYGLDSGFQGASAIGDTSAVTGGSMPDAASLRGTGGSVATVGSGNPGIYSGLQPYMQERAAMQRRMDETYAARSRAIDEARARGATQEEIRQIAKPFDDTIASLRFGLQVLPQRYGYISDADLVSQWAIEDTLAGVFRNPGGLSGVGISGGGGGGFSYSGVGINPETGLGSSGSESWYGGAIEMPAPPPGMSFSSTHYPKGDSSKKVDVTMIVPNPDGRTVAQNFSRAMEELGMGVR